MEDILGIIFVVFSFGAILLLAWALIDADREEMKKEPFIIRLIDALSQEAPKHPSAQSPYPQEEWSSSDPTQTVEPPQAPEDPCNAAGSSAMTPDEAVPSSLASAAHAHPSRP